MSHKRVVDNYYVDVNNLVDVLSKLVSSYRLLIGGAAELNQIALAKKKDIKDAIDRASDLGDIIDKVIESLEKTEGTYLDYCKLKSKILECKVESQFVETEIDEELKLKD
ncbi:MAG: hypothetical protein K0R54_1909 [Clostridiaceae bacterium]|jgi:hypothetical protein|nr:hypothetical protein [Clostridiaceae bacterium]